MIAILRNFFRPSLVGRLIVSQVVVLFLLETALFAASYYSGSSAQNEQDRDLIVRSTEFLVQLVSERDIKTSQLTGQLETFDQLVNELTNSLGALDKPAGIKIFVWEGSNLIYKSKHSTKIFQSSIQDQIYTAQFENVNWLVLAKYSSNQKFKVVVMVPESLVGFGAVVNLPNWFIMSLVINLPFLILPVWLSTRLALKPWRNLTHEIATKKSSDYAPLAFKSRLVELGTLVQSVNGMLERIKGTRLREQSFLADAAHELRTPIAAIQMNAEALASHDLSSKDHELLTGLLKSSLRAGRLVEQLMALSRSESTLDERSFKSINLTNLVPDCLAEMAPMARSAQVELSLNIEPNVLLNADEQSIRVLIENVVGNAIKYAPDGAVVIDLTQTAESVCMTVVDEGPGISSDKLNRVFDRFYRPAGQRQTGSGLGLAIVKRVAKMHEADIALLNRTERSGLIVSIRFPKKIAVF